MKMKKLMLLPVFAVAGLIVFNAFKNAGNIDKPDAANAGLTLPVGFSASIIADNLGSARHLVVTPENDIYIHLAGTKNGKGIVVLHENGNTASIKTSLQLSAALASPLKTATCTHPTAPMFSGLN